jgi:teichuronic acid biosynthesis protein TuaE
MAINARTVTRPTASIRLPSAVSANFLRVALASIASVAIGAIATRSPVAAISVVVVAIVVVIALTRPARLFAVGLVLLAIESTRIFGPESLIGRPGTYKLVLYACALPLLLDRGVARRKCAPLIAYLTLVLLTESLATPLAGLTTGQTASSLATLCLGWVVFAINWDWRRDQLLLKVLAWVPTLSVLIGAMLDAAGVISLFRATPPRLEGATLAASLGAFGVAATVACVTLNRRAQWKWAGTLGLLNVVILGATLSRGAALALCIASIPLLIRFWRRQLSERGIAVVAKVAVAVTVVSVSTVVLGSGLIERSDNATAYVVGRGQIHEVGSGRFEAWTVAYDQAKVNLAFGRGLGAGPLVGKTPGSPEGFTAQHNEYLRLLLEGGIVGGVVVLLAIVTTMVSVIRRAPREIRADLAAAGLAFAVYSFTENTLTAPAIAIAFLLAISVGGSRASPSPLNTAKI